MDDKPSTMDEKQVSVTPGEEKQTAVATEPEVTSTGGRRESVALNIVQNPLQVSVISPSCEAKWTI